MDSLEEIDNIMKVKALKENSNIKREEARLAKLKYRRSIIMGSEEGIVMTADGKEGKGGVFKTGGIGLFEILTGRAMTEGEFMDFNEKYEKAEPGWGIKDYIKANNISD